VLPPNDGVPPGVHCGGVEVEDGVEGFAAWRFFDELGEAVADALALPIR